MTPAEAVKPTQTKTMDTTQSPTELAAVPCSAATVREALQRCAAMDDGWASSAMYDAEKCQQSDHPAIRARADELKSRAENYKLSAARYRSALDWTG